MYRLNRMDAWILLAIYRAGNQNKTDYAGIVSCLPDISLAVPTHQEFKAAYNKFLYIKFIVADGANTSLAPAAQQLVEAAQPEPTIGVQDWVEAIFNTLATYKCKSICNRHEWQEAQYLHGVELFSELKGDNNAN
jgi:nicotinamidase-related amidase